MGVAVALALTGISGAVAADRPSGADQTADLISEVAPDQGAVVQGQIGSDTVSAQVGDTRTAVPLDPAGAITVTSTGSDAAGAGSLQVRLPAQVDAREGQIADDGTVVFASKSSGGADAAVQTLGDGSVRIQTVTKDASGPTAFTYEFGDDVTPVVNDDGSVDLLQSLVGGGAAQVGHVEPAWAKDADGASLPTRYTVQGNLLTQTVTTNRETAYPVVADPKIGIGLHVYVYLNKLEIQAMATAAGGILAAGTSVGCAYLGTKFKTFKIGPWIGYVCGVVGINKLFSFLKALPSRSASAYQSSCYEYRIPAQGQGWKPVSYSNCQTYANSFKW